MRMISDNVYETDDKVDLEKVRYCMKLPKGNKSIRNAFLLPDTPPNAFPYDVDTDSTSCNYCNIRDFFISQVPSSHFSSNENDEARLYNNIDPELLKIIACELLITLKKLTENGIIPLKLSLSRVVISKNMSKIISHSGTVKFSSPWEFDFNEIESTILSENTIAMIKCSISNILTANFENTKSSEKIITFVRNNLQRCIGNELKDILNDNTSLVFEALLTKLEDDYTPSNYKYSTIYNFYYVPIVSFSFDSSSSNTEYISGETIAKMNKLVSGFRERIKILINYNRHFKSGGYRDISIEEIFILNRPISKEEDIATLDKINDTVNIIVKELPDASEEFAFPLGRYCANEQALFYAMERIKLDMNTSDLGINTRAVLILADCANDGNISRIYISSGRHEALMTCYLKKLEALEIESGGLIKIIHLSNDANAFYGFRDNNNWDIHLRDVSLLDIGKKCGLL